MQPGIQRVVSRGIIDCLPLVVAVIPWGILCGSMAIDVGLTGVESVLMSVLIFAGAAQLGALVLFGAGASLASLLSSTAVISSRHLLYSASFRDDVKHKPRWLRLLIAFVLTDEMFALVMAYKRQNGQFNTRYALATGFTFYFGWILATIAGVLLGEYLPNLQQYGLEFAIAATFIALVVPSIKDRPTLVATLISFILSALFHHWQLPQALLIATAIGMIAGMALVKTKQVTA